MYVQIIHANLIFCVLIFENFPFSFPCNSHSFTFYLCQDFLIPVANYANNTERIFLKFFIIMKSYIDKYIHMSTYAHIHDFLVIILQYKKKMHPRKHTALHLALQKKYIYKQKFSKSADILLTILFNNCIISHDVDLI